MIRYCENCYVPYDTERNGNEYFCPKCMGQQVEVIENGLD
jgi:Zn finger protein HypA/HybF involved in hydrogenase expression|tara:strand:+ start:15189 stop:15308 length:120 start_codon:yes stop_codon:yes gene_type:complete